MKFVLKAIIGNIAYAVWFFPPLKKALYWLNGVRMKRPSSIFIGTGVVLDNRFPELVEIGEGAYITTGCIVLAHSSVSEYQQNRFALKEQVAPVKIGRGAFIGAGSILLPGTDVGEGAFIGAGSVVRGSIPPGVLAAGNPAKVIKTLSDV